MVKTIIFRALVAYVVFSGLMIAFSVLSSTPMKVSMLAALAFAYLIEERPSSASRI